MMSLLSVVLDLVNQEAATEQMYKCTHGSGSRRHDWMSVGVTNMMTKSAYEKREHSPEHICRCGQSSICVLCAPISSLGYTHQLQWPASFSCR
mmetsp:Transcript_10822/g.25991  ORF Transcript_10822/g.25991 Transcript_10822/m.25991 type:complete len:93 (+) Transcript_10822:108-386(+)